MLTDRLARFFDPSVRQRGQRYFAEGRVARLRVQGDSITAAVAGSDIYDVFIDLERGSTEWVLRVSCTCPYGEDHGGCCKHLWAVLLKAERAAAGKLGNPPARVRLEASDEADDPGMDFESDDPEDEDADAGGAGRSIGIGGRTYNEPRSVNRNDPGPGGRGRARKKGRKPEWTRLVDGAPVVYSHERRREPEPAGALLYVLDAARSRERGVMMLAVLREQAAAGPRAKRPKKANLSAADVARLADQSDRVICGMLVGAAKPGREWGYPYGYADAYQERTSLWQVDSRLLPVLGPLLRETGRFSWRPDENAAHVPVVWEGDGGEEEWWELALAIEAAGDGKRFVARGVVRRGSERVPLREPDLLLDGDPGLMLRGGVLSPVRMHGCFQWVARLREVEGVGVERKELPRLLEGLGQKGLTLPVSWPAEWGVREVTDLAPRPRLTLTAKGGGGSVGRVGRADGSAGVSVSFTYAGVTVGPHEPGVYLAQPASTSGPGGERGDIIRRQHDAEQRCLDRLKELGLRADPYTRGHHVPAKRIPALVATLLDEGWDVLGDKALYRRAGAVTVHVSSGIDWFDLEGEADFGGVSAPVGDILEALRREERFVTLGDGSLGLLPEEWIARHGRWLRLGRVEDGVVRFSKSQVTLIDALLVEMPGATCDAQVAAARRRLAAFEGVRERGEPTGFTGSLRGYQREGLGWLRFLSEFGFGGCLADDMGLGKTVQLLAHIADGRADRRASEKEDEVGPWLVVAPKSLVFNWAREAERFTPGLKVVDYTGVERAAHRDGFAGVDLVLTTYGTLRKDVERLRGTEFACVVLDEAQAIKNAGSQGAKAARLLRARRRLALTGTPVENRLDDLWSIFEFLNPGMLGAANSFSVALKGGTDAEGERLALLRRALRPFILRRTKERVAPELPARSEQTIVCDLEGRQRTLYDALRKRYRDELLGRVDRDGLKNTRIHVLEALLRLRQAACHPALIEAKPKPGGSAKVATLLEMLTEVVQEGHKALVFSQFTSLLALLRAELDAAGVVYEYLDGKTPTKARAETVDRFQTDPECRAFLISLKAGGVGLNLTAADYVFLLDPWWNPAVEAQAINRTHRIGQDKRVFAYRLIARGTVEERIMELQKSKRELAEAIVAEREGPLSALTREDLEWLLS